MDDTEGCLDVLGALAPPQERIRRLAELCRIALAKVPLDPEVLEELEEHEAWNGDISDYPFEEFSRPWYLREIAEHGEKIIGVVEAGNTWGAIGLAMHLGWLLKEYEVKDYEIPLDQGLRSEMGRKQAGEAKRKKYIPRNLELALAYNKEREATPKSVIKDTQLKLKICEEHAKKRDKSPLGQSACCRRSTRV